MPFKRRQIISATGCMAVPLGIIVAAVCLLLGARSPSRSFRDFLDGRSQDCIKNIIVATDTKMLTLDDAASIAYLNDRILDHRILQAKLGTTYQCTITMTNWCSVSAWLYVSDEPGHIVIGWPIDDWGDPLNYVIEMRPPVPAGLRALIESLRHPE